jgi:hypothetical protein
MQDSASGIVGCTSSRIGRDLVWKFLQTNWTKLVQRFGEKSSFLISFVDVKLKQFFHKKKFFIIDFL